MESPVKVHAGETMRAIVQEGYGSADVLQLREIDKPVVTDDRVLVRVRAASVNALDWHTVHGGWFMRTAAFVMRAPTFPVRGADVAGEVEAVGKNVTRLRPGDEVFGTGRGTFAEYTTAREDRLVPKPQQLSFAQAATIGVAAITALQGLRDRGQLQPGQRALIHGAGGGVGTFAVQIAKALGAHVTAVTSTRNVELVRSIGPDEVIDYTQEDFTPARAAVRRDPRRRRDPVLRGLPASPDSEREARAGWRLQERWVRRDLACPHGDRSVTPRDLLARAVPGDRAL